MPTGVYARKPLAERFAAKVNVNGPIPAHRPDLGPCHEWTGATQSQGYGEILVDGRPQLAHRVAFRLAEGRWPEPCALHHCDNHPCVNRGHLFEGTKHENSLDMAAKGRGGRPRKDGTRRAPLTQCRTNEPGNAPASPSIESEPPGPSRITGLSTTGITCGANPR
jgi:hypothetical protein